MKQNHGRIVNNRKKGRRSRDSTCITFIFSLWIIQFSLAQQPGVSKQMNVIIILALILFILMKLIGKEKGTKAFFSLIINFLIIFTAIMLIAHNLNPIVITILACILISYVSLFTINGKHPKTYAAFWSTLLTLAVLFFFIYFIGYAARIQGFSEEEFEEISLYSLYIGTNFTKLIISTIIMSLIGAIIDTAISISSSMNEVFLHNPSITRRKLFESGLNISRDILGTTTNTLYFAFVGGYMALILWLKDLHYSFGTIINSKVFCSEIISILCSSLGVTLIIPITAGITSYILLSKKQPAVADGNLSENLEHLSDSSPGLAIDNNLSTDKKDIIKGDDIP